MAWMNQERKATLAPRVKEILKRYGLKGSLRVRHHSTLILTIRSGRLDFIANAIAEQSWRNPPRANSDAYAGSEGYLQVNHYHLSRSFSGECLEALVELTDAMNAGNHDRSDLMTDYHDVGWYTSISIGSWDRPYEVLS